MTKTEVHFKLAQVIFKFVHTKSKVKVFYDLMTQFLIMCHFACSFIYQH